jgi:hypothetical protein
MKTQTLSRLESIDKVHHRSLRSESVGAKAVGALAVGAIAFGALAFGAVAIGALAIGRARIRRVEIDDLVVRRLRILEDVDLPGNVERTK